MVPGARGRRTLTKVQNPGLWPGFRFLLVSLAEELEAGAAALARAADSQWWYQVVMGYAHLLTHGPVPSVTFVPVAYVSQMVQLLVQPEDV
jgi:hypothetical protein